MVVAADQTGLIMALLDEWEKQRIVLDFFTVYNIADALMLPANMVTTLPNSCFTITGEEANLSAHLEFFFSGTF